MRCWLNGCKNNTDLRCLSSDAVHSIGWALINIMRCGTGILDCAAVQALVGSWFGVWKGPLASINGPPIKPCEPSSTLLVSTSIFLG